ncbi:MAG: helix-turn-helix domain-containing protein, partial [Cyanobacteria bacterium J06607_13]
MAPRKLSDSDKNEIIDLYREPGETTSTLAERFGVSNSTVSRILKNALPSEEYSELIAQKRMAGSDKSDTPKRSRAKRRKSAERLAKSNGAIAAKDTAAADDTDDAQNPTKTVAPPKLKKADKDTAEQAAEAPTDKPRRRRRRSRRKEEEDGQLPLLETAADAEEEIEATESPVLSVDDDEDEDDDLLGLDETLGDDFGDDDDLDEEDEDDEADDGGVELPKPKLQPESAVEIMPLAQAVLPKPCYLVVDMRAELITRPLREFADLGQIPSSEETANTLPVFDNHRVARRFSRNKQRVIKVPDGSLITRTRPYLQAKGITRLLVDGQVF